MRKHVLFLLPLTSSLMNCSQKTCQIKITTDSHVIIEELKQGNTINAPINQDLILNLEGKYYHNLETYWRDEPTHLTEGLLEDPNIKYLVDVRDIQVLVNNEIINDAFLFHPHIKNKSTLTLKKEYVKDNVEIKINSHIYDEDMGLCLFGCELDDNLKTRRENGEIDFTFTSKYQNIWVPIKTLNQQAYPIFEDDTMQVKLTVNQQKSNQPLPDDLWFRTNARFAEIDEEFTRVYENNNMTCTITVPHYIIKDHCAIRSKA